MNIVESIIMENDICLILNPSSVSPPISKPTDDPGNRWTGTCGHWDWCLNKAAGLQGGLDEEMLSHCGCLKKMATGELFG